MITQKERFEELCRLDGTSNHDVERKSLFYIILLLVTWIPGNT